MSIDAFVGAKMAHRLKAELNVGHLLRYLIQRYPRALEMIDRHYEFGEFFDDEINLSMQSPLINGGHRESTFPRHSFSP